MLLFYKLNANRNIKKHQIIVSGSIYFLLSFLLPHLGVWDTRFIRPLISVHIFCFYLTLYYFEKITKAIPISYIKWPGSVWKVYILKYVYIIQPHTGWKKSNLKSFLFLKVVHNLLDLNIRKKQFRLLFPKCR